jgi:hypothetical protein
MDIVDEKTFLCMDVMFKTNLKKPDYSLTFYLKSVHFSFTKIVDLEIKNQRSLLQGCRCLMNLNVMVFTQWNHLSVETIKVHSKIIILLLLI